MYNKDIRILFWNARSVTKREEELSKLLHNVDIFVCVGKWLSEKDELQVPGFKILRKDRTYANGGGVLFLVKNHLDATEITNTNNIDGEVEICGLKINNTSPQLDIFACYRPPGHPRKIILTDIEWDNIVGNVKDNAYSILLGDFNAHHTAWNCKQNDANCKRFLNSIV